MLRESQIRGFARTATGRVTKSLEESSVASARVSIFLSHSHKDRDLIEDVIAYLLHAANIHVYVDWQDSGMPSTTSRETAERIKRRIKELDVFVVLATNNACASRWVPWEVGIADYIRGPERMAVLPIADSTGTFIGNEYLQLYKRIIPRDKNALAVFPPGIHNGYALRTWLENPLLPSLPSTRP